MKRIGQGLLVWLVLVCSVAASELDKDLAQFRKDVLDINRRLLLLEEELLFPADTQLAVFVSLDHYRFEYDDFRDIRAAVPVAGEEPLYGFSALVSQLLFSVWY